MNTPITELKSVPADEGMKSVIQMLHTNYVAEVSGVKAPYISRGANHNIVNGKPYWYSDTQVVQLQDALRVISSRLMLTQILPGEVTAEQQPLAYGATYVEKFSNLRNHVSLQYLLNTMLGWTDGKIKMKLSRKNGRYLGYFTDEEVAAVNSAIRQLALQIGSIELENVNPVL